MTFPRLKRLFKRAEQYFKTDLRYIIKGGFWLTTSKLVTSASSFVTSIVFANFIPKEVYGLYRFILSYLSVLTLPTLAGIDTSLTKSVGRGYRGSIIPAFKTKIRWGLLAGLASLGFAGYYYWQQNSTLAISFLLATFFLPIMDPLQIYMSYLNGKKDYVTYTKYHTLLKIFVTIIIVGTLLFTHNLILIILSYLVSYTLLRLIFFIITVKQMKPSNEIDSRIISYGKHLSLMGVLGTIAIALDKILVFHFVGAAALASYYLAMIPYKQIQNFVSSLNILALPKFASNTTENLRVTLPQKIIRTYALIIPIIIVYIIIAPYAFKFLYPKYLDMVWLSIIFISQLMFTPIYLFNTALIAQGKKRKLYILSISYALVKISLVSIFTPLWGLPGAVAVVLITSAFGAISNFWAFYR